MSELGVGPGKLLKWGRGMGGIEGASLSMGRGSRGTNCRRGISEGGDPATGENLLTCPGMEYTVDTVWPEEFSGIRIWNGFG